MSLCSERKRCRCYPSHGWEYLQGRRIKYIHHSGHRPGVQNKTGIGICRMRCSSIDELSRTFEMYKYSHHPTNCYLFSISSLNSIESDVCLNQHEGPFDHRQLGSHCCRAGGNRTTIRPRTLHAWHVPLQRQQHTNV